MTFPNDLGTRVSQQLKQEAPQRAPDRVLLATLPTVETTQQRRVRAPWRTSNLNALFRVVAVAAAALAIIFGPLSLLPRGVAPNAGASPLPTAATSPSAAVLPPTDCPAGTVLKSGDIATIGGGGASYESAGDGGPALQATLSPSYYSVAVDSDGAFYFGDPSSQSVRRIGTDGIITAFVGPKTGASLVYPEGVAFDAKGNLYIADPKAARIWKRDQAGTVTSIAGTGTVGSSGDEGPATDAQIQPTTVAIGPQGDIYFDDVNEVRRIDPDGTVHAFESNPSAYVPSVGGGQDETWGIGPFPAAVAPDGSVYISDPAHARVQKADPSGHVTTVAGSGAVGIGGDGGPAIDAELEGYPNLLGDPYGIAVATDGTFYITDAANNTIRKVDPDGIISTVAGVNVGHPENAGFQGDCGSATAPGTRLKGPAGIVLHDGTLYFIDGFNSRVRILVP
jgi:streptogramin lyase